MWQWHRAGSVGHQPSVRGEFGLERLLRATLRDDVHRYLTTGGITVLSLPFLASQRPKHTRKQCATSDVDGCSVHHMVDLSKYVLHPLDILTFLLSEERPSKGAAGFALGGREDVA